MNQNMSSDRFRAKNTRVSKSTHPLMGLCAGIVHPELVCNDIIFGDTSLTPSTMSTSPRLGQLERPVSQAAGHVPHPCGICLISKLGSR